MRALALAVLLLVLAGCGGGGATETAATSCPVGEGNVWYACQMTSASAAAPLVARDLFDAESFFHPGDYVVNCPSGQHTRVLATSTDSTAQLEDGRWISFDDLIQDGPPYDCAGQRREDWQ
jgi:hypothetical protein